MQYTYEELCNIYDNTDNTRTKKTIASVFNNSQIKLNHLHQWAYNRHLDIIADIYEIIAQHLYTVELKIIEINDPLIRVQYSYFLSRAEIDDVAVKSWNVQRSEFMRKIYNTDHLLYKLQDDIIHKKYDLIL